MKRILALILAIAMVATFCVACGNKADAPVSDAPAADAPAADAPAADDDAEEINLSVILIDGSHFYEEAFKQYEADHPGVNIDVQIMPTGDYLTLIKTKMAANDAPDIMPVFAYPDFIDFYKNGYLSDMTETVGRASPGTLDGFYVDGGLISLPYTMEILMCYYNKDVFEANNIAIPNSWEELMAACEALKAAGVTPVTMGAKDGWCPIMAPYSMCSSTVQAVDPDFTAGTTDGSSKFAESAGWLQAITSYNELFEKGYVNEGSLSTSADQMYEMFIKQEAAMFFGGTWCAGSVAALNPEFTVSAFQIPAPGGNVAKATSVSGGYGVSGKSENVEAAKDLLAYMMSKEVLEAYAGGLTSAYNDVKAVLEPSVQDAFDLQAELHGYEYVCTYFASGVQDTFIASLQEMIAGNKTPMQVLEDMDLATAKANR